MRLVRAAPGLHTHVLTFLSSATSTSIPALQIHEPCVPAPESKQQTVCGLSAAKMMIVYGHAGRYMSGADAHLEGPCPTCPECQVWLAASLLEDA